MSDITLRRAAQDPLNWRCGVWTRVMWRLVAGEARLAAETDRPAEAEGRL
jgi:hypothetical protein